MAPEVRFTRKIFPLYPVGIRHPPHKKIDNVTPKKPTFLPLYNSRDGKARKSCAGDEEKEIQYCHRFQLHIFLIIIKGGSNPEERKFVAMVKEDAVRRRSYRR
jgi:hypothetical protein